VVRSKAVDPLPSFALGRLRSSALIPILFDGKKYLSYLYFNSLLVRGGVLLKRGVLSVSRSLVRGGVSVF